jgi:Fe-S-cluster-containing hydrogenase component 2
MVVSETPEACTGCLICELACSFHNVRKHSRAYSRVSVRKLLFNPKRQADIVIHRKQEGSHPPCDSCCNEQVPFCIRFCPENIFRLVGDSNE